MVIRGKTRGNGAQLADYLVRVADNDNVRVFDIRGTSQSNDLKFSLLEMSLTSELTRSDKGLYHAQINPAYGEDKAMQTGDWLKAADMLENELGLAGQKRVIVLHEKKNRIHAHVVWERYDHEKGIMISDSFSRLAQDRARKTMEHDLEQKKTPERNAKRPEMKKTLSEIWQKTVTGTEFVKEAVLKGYTIARGQLRRPYIVVDQTGRSFDLVRQISQARTKDVAERLKKEKLPTEREAIAFIRDKEKERAPSDDVPQLKEKSGPQEQGAWVKMYEQKQKQELTAHKETVKEKMVRELLEQLEAQRQKNRERSR
ncbi:hypothetical protein JMG10_03420 [Nostoc ellipsosporum NOK]|nr:hypothetical protein [Nostoc ellipsosporum NOK]